jgi:hypothetical protein
LSAGCFGKPVVDLFPSSHTTNPSAIHHVPIFSIAHYPMG